MNFRDLNFWDSETKPGLFHPLRGKLTSFLGFIFNVLLRSSNGISTTSSAGGLEADLLFPRYVCQDLKQYSELSSSPRPYFKIQLQIWKVIIEVLKKQKERVFLKQLGYNLSLKGKSEENYHYFNWNNEEFPC